MHVPFGDDAVERRLQREVLFEILDRLHLRLRGLDRIIVGTHERLRRFGGLLGHDDVVFGTTPGVADAAFSRSYVLCAPASLASASARWRPIACALDCASTICV